MTFKRADILLPKFSKDAEKMKKWSVVACDQYTSEPDYWHAVSDCVGESESTFKLTVPEIYLNDKDIEQRIKNTNAEMEKYMAENIFNEYKNTYIFVERTLASGVKRLGIVGAVDLEDYDYSSDSQTKIRATEGTVVSRIPPRLKVRCEAMIELPHIMMLIDDESCQIIEPNADITDGFEKVYDFDLMQSSGHITGYKMSDEACETLDRKLMLLADIDGFNKKYSEDAIDKEPPYDLYYKSGELLTELENTVLELKPSEVSEVIKTEYAFHIIEKQELDDGKLNDYYDDLREEKCIDELKDNIDKLQIIYNDAYENIKIK